MTSAPPSNTLINRAGRILRWLGLGFLALLAVQCVRAPNTFLHNVLTPFYTGDGILAIDSQDNDGDISVYLGRNGQGFRLKVPSTYVEGKVQPEMTEIHLKLNYKTFKPAYNFGAGAPPENISIYLSRGIYNDDWIRKDFDALAAKNILIKQESNIWFVPFDDTIEQRKIIKEILPHSSAMYLTSAADKGFMQLPNGSIVQFHCPERCDIVSAPVGNDAKVRLGFHKQELQNVPVILQQVEKFISQYRIEAPAK